MSDGGKQRGEYNGRRRYSHAMVVLMRPTLVKSAIFANSMAKAGVSTILSLRTLEHLGELYSALT